MAFGVVVPLLILATFLEKLTITRSIDRLVTRLETLLDPHWPPQRDASLDQALKIAWAARRNAESIPVARQEEFDLLLATMIREGCIRRGYPLNFVLEAAARQIMKRYAAFAYLRVKQDCLELVGRESGSRLFYYQFAWEFHDGRYGNV